MERREWLDARRSGLGSSDAAQVCGLSSYGGPLAVWLNKTGRVPDTDDTPATKRGRAAEATVAELYKLETGAMLRRHQRLVKHPVNTWVLCTPDYQIFERDPDGDHSLKDGTKTKATKLLECKTTRHWTGGKLWRDDMPDEVLIQVLHQLYVTEMRYADVACWVVDNDDLIIVPVDFNEHQDIWDSVLQLEHDFWFNHVVPDVRPPVDDTPGTVRAVVQAYATFKPGKRAQLDPSVVSDYLDVGSRLAAARAAVRALEKEQTIYKTELYAQLEDAELGEVDGEVRVIKSEVNVGERVQQAYSYPRLKVLAPTDLDDQF